MHLIDAAAGVMGTVPLVGATIPIAVGAAFAYKLRGDGRVAVAFFGDGATEEGHFHESLNLASLYRLPVLFVCENNGYGMSTSIKRSTAVENVADRAAAYNMPGIVVDGNNLSDVAEAAHEAIERARRGEGDKGGFAARAALTMIALRERFGA